MGRVLRTIKHRLRGFAGRHESLVLTYHSILSSPSAFPVWHHMHVERFEEQIAYAARNRRCIGVGRLVDEIRSGNIQPYTLAVTFDDGFANNLHIALPILERYSVPATFFLTAGTAGSGELLWPERLALMLRITLRASAFVAGIQLDLAEPAGKAAAYRALARECKRLEHHAISEFLATVSGALEVREEDIRDHPLRDDYRTLSWEEAERLSRSPLAEIGAHTLTHNMLSRLSEDEARREIVESRKILISRLKAARFLAYPYGGAGDFGAEHTQMAIDAGYTAAFTSIAAGITRTTDVYRIPRVGVGSAMQHEEFVYALNGGIVRTAS